MSNSIQALIYFRVIVLPKPVIVIWFGAPTDLGVVKVDLNRFAPFSSSLHDGPSSSVLRRSGSDGRGRSCITGTAAGFLCLLLLPAVGWCVSSVISSAFYYSGISRLQGFPSRFDKLKVIAKVCPGSIVQSQLEKGYSRQAANILSNARSSLTPQCVALTW